MSPLPSLPFALLLSSCLPLLTHAAVTQADITGHGKIYVLASSDFNTANPSQTVGCLTDSGRFLGLAKPTSDDKRTPDEKNAAEEECGLFSKLKDYPYTTSSREGNCTFNNEKTEKNVDSVYGRDDHAWSCDKDLEATVYDGLYTIDGLNYPLLCWGDIACFYDSNSLPGPSQPYDTSKAPSKAPLWQFRWGSQQRGITPGHFMLQLLYSKVGEEKRDEEEGRKGKFAPGPRVELHQGVQARLWGDESRWR